FLLATMGSLSLTSISIAPKGTARFSDVKHDNILFKKRRDCVVCCQGGGNATKTSSVLSTILTERSPTLMGVDHVTALMENTAVKDLVPYGGPAGPLVDIQDNDEGIGIVEFLRGKGFLITGATGFLAKVLIEKIIRTVPDVGKIYLLIKAKNKEAAMERLKNEIINTELFKCLQQKYGKSYEAFMLSKLVPVVGNVCEPNIGANENIADVIARDVDIIVNSAANTTFDERYDIALDINTGGPSRLMSFAKKCKKLKLLLHISTAYVNGQRQGRIMEKAFCVGDSIARENFVLETSETSSLPILDVEEELKARKYGWQDTYVFTKAMGEMLIDKMREEIPIVIIRPSVVESTYKEPFPGWIEGNRMMDPIVLYYGKGQLSGFLVDPNGVLDVVPADMVVNTTLAAIAKHGAAGKAGTNVYQIASSVVNPLVFQDLAELLHEHFNSSPCLDPKGRPIRVPTMKLFNSVDDFSSHVWRDAVHRIGLTSTANPNGKLSRKLENMCGKLVEQAKYLANLYEPYTFYGGRFDNSNTQRLMGCMSGEERKMFGFDVENIDWKEYISKVHIPGLRRHVMKGRGMCS
ncbi:hypothetical protein RJ639_004655, partial [Escallonia herrerae]